jgi:hypothetical protein
VSNSISTLFQTVVSAATEASKVLAPTWGAVESIFWNYDPDNPQAVGNTVNVIIPQDPTNAVQDIGGGDAQITDIGFNATPIVINRHPEFGFVVRDFEQVNTQSKIRAIFMDAALKGIKSNINATVAGLFTTGNFPTNPVISTTGHAITITQFLQGMAVLLDKNVPANTDLGNMTCLLPSYPYTTIMDATTGGPGAAWSQAFIGGNRTAEFIREYGAVPNAFGTMFRLDQQMPTSGSVGSRTFTGAYFHRYAIAGVSRPLSADTELAEKVVDTAVINFGGISVRIMIGYNQIKLGPVITIDAAYGLKVVRPEMAQLFTIAE